MYHNELHFKSIRIPIRITNGVVQNYYGGGLPDIKEGITGELILPEISVKDKEFVRIFQEERKYEIVKPGNKVYLAFKNVDKDKKSITKFIATELGAHHYVEVELKKSLVMLFRGSKLPTLLETECFIPELKKEASSINNAYMIISQEIQPQRKSHTGNVFKYCFYYRNDGYYSLDYAREKIQANYDNELFLSYSLYKLNDSIIDLDKFGLSDDAKKLIEHLEKYNEINGWTIKVMFEGKSYNYITLINELLSKQIIYMVNK
ncbi:hypothetical protein J2Z35_002523 [Acetoanaerobium pronyense]|uniref:Uncharacterized protein n=1 Tax=Acetoanaerobium pronyense TaxID=1482736 RepID=A0ABS4KLP0_9FIRM|nr:hypothetical protein [Acetoanaerobium pronyense]MBP2028693.1 hypothetical protein [Acetoanaerobium pronyense]